MVLHAIFESLGLWLNTIHSNEHLDLAEANYRQAYMHSSALFSRADSRALRALANLVVFLRFRGKIEEADDLKDLLTDAFDEWSGATEAEQSRVLPVVQSRFWSPMLILDFLKEHVAWPSGKIRRIAAESSVSVILEPTMG